MSPHPADNACSALVLEYPIATSSSTDELACSGPFFCDEHLAFISVADDLERIKYTLLNCEIIYLNSPQLLRHEYSHGQDLEEFAQSYLVEWIVSLTVYL